MAGLSLNMLGGAKVTGSGSGYSSVDTNASATAQAFGPGYTAPGTPSMTQALIPNDPFGVTFWAGIIALGGLLFIRHSLPG